MSQRWLTGWGWLALIVLVLALAACVEPPGEGQRGPAGVQATRVPRPTATSGVAETQPTPDDEAAIPSADEAQSDCGGPFGPIEQGRVTDVIDGDTIEVELDGVAYRVRYIGIDTPERDETFYEEAANANAQLVAGQEVFLERDVSDTDRYGRLLRYVYTDDGRFVNALLVDNGLAFAATFPPDVKCEPLFRSLQAAAREDGVGLWGTR